MVNYIKHGMDEFSFINKNTFNKKKYLHINFILISYIY